MSSFESLVQEGLEAQQRFVEENAAIDQKWLDRRQKGEVQSNDSQPAINGSDEGPG